MGGGELSNLGALPEVLTPELFTFIARTRLPYAVTDTIDFAEFGRKIFLEDDFGPVARGRVWPALLALGSLGIDEMLRLDPSHFLPPPADPTYPEQCLGLLLLLDHCPRLLFRGADARYTYGYFAFASARLAHDWLALPPALRPGARDRRWGSRGTAASLDYWIAVRFWLGTPLVHSQEPADQEAALAFTDEMRSTVEAETGCADPYRRHRAAILSDLYGFPRVFHAGPPQQGAGASREGWAFWMGMLMDVHKPIIDRFGRYPYLNAILGRESTAEEAEWSDRTDHFGEASSEVAHKIREDVRLGRWRSLGEDSNVEVSK